MFKYLPLMLDRLGYYRTIPFVVEITFNAILNVVDRQGSIQEPTRGLELRDGT